MFLKDSMILELLASWKYEKQPVMTTTAVSTMPRYNWKEREIKIYTVSGGGWKPQSTVCVKSIYWGVVYINTYESLVWQVC